MALLLLLLRGEIASVPCDCAAGDRPESAGGGTEGVNGGGGAGRDAPVWFILVADITVEMAGIGPTPAKLKVVLLLPLPPLELPGEEAAAAAAGLLNPSRGLLPWARMPPPVVAVTPGLNAGLVAVIEGPR